MLLSLRDLRRVFKNCAMGQEEREMGSVFKVYRVFLWSDEKGPQRR